MIIEVEARNYVVNRGLWTETVDAVVAVEFWRVITVDSRMIPNRSRKRGRKRWRSREWVCAHRFVVFAHRFDEQLGAQVFWTSTVPGAATTMSNTGWAKFTAWP